MKHRDWWAILCAAGSGDNQKGKERPTTRHAKKNFVEFRRHCSPLVEATSLPGDSSKVNTET